MCWLICLCRMPCLTCIAVVGTVKLHLTFLRGLRLQI
uniref:Uncharacterized protein n=1 Tax=Rhizophora mucronata TaxID=61149 RepID=A0A2P2N1B4_RHIMU